MSKRLEAASQGCLLVTLVAAMLIATVGFLATRLFINVGYSPGALPNSGRYFHVFIMDDPTETVLIEFTLGNHYSPAAPEAISPPPA